MKMLRATFFAFVMFAMIGAYFYSVRQCEGWYHTFTRVVMPR